MEENVLIFTLYIKQLRKNTQETNSSKLPVWGLEEEWELERQRTGGGGDILLSTYMHI